MDCKDFTVGQLVLVGGVNGVSAKEVKSIGEGRVKIGYVYYGTDGVAVKTDGVAATYIVPGNGGFNSFELLRLFEAQEAAKVFLADIPLNQYRAALAEGTDWIYSQGNNFLEFSSTAALPGLKRREFEKITLVIRMREADTSVLVDGKLMKGKGWEAFVKATDLENEESASATVVFGDWFAAIGLAAKEVFAKLPW